ncbi:MAG: ATP-dependent zinc metalloprotease FtsH, partial [Pseudoflavonifractor sp.]
MIIALFCVMLFALQGIKPEKPVYYSQIRELFDAQQVRAVEVRDDRLTLQLWEPMEGKYEVKYDLYSLQMFYDEFNPLIVKQHGAGIIEAYDYPAPSRLPMWLATFGPWLLVLLVFGLFWYFNSKRQQNGGGINDKTEKFGKARVKTAAD